MDKKIVVLGGGTGMSSLVKGLKQFPVEISAVVSVSDDGRSTGILRKEFDQIAVGDIRQVLVALSDTEPLVEKLFNYRFKTTSDLNGHTAGNLLLTAMASITGNMSDGIESLSRILNLKGNVIPFTEDNVDLMAEMTDGTVVEGEHNITDAGMIDGKTIKKIYYKKKARVNPRAIQAINDAELIILSMGSVYTSIIPNLLCKDITKAIDASKAKIMYTCNMMTQPGETDNFKASDHVKLLNKYLGKRKVDVIVGNNEEIGHVFVEKYATLEQKDPVILDCEELQNMKVKIIREKLVLIENDIVRHDALKLALAIFSYTIRNK